MLECLYKSSFPFFHRLFWFISMPLLRLSRFNKIHVQFKFFSFLWASKDPPNLLKFIIPGKNQSEDSRLLLPRYDKINKSERINLHARLFQVTQILHTHSWRPSRWESIARTIYYSLANSIFIIVIIFNLSKFGENSFSSSLAENLKHEIRFSLDENFYLPAENQW